MLLLLEALDKITRMPEPCLLAHMSDGHVRAADQELLRLPDAKAIHILQRPQAEGAAEQCADVLRRYLQPIRHLLQETSS